MKKSPSLIAAIAAALFLAGCAGTDFKRPESTALQVGKSTNADVLAVMGTPRRTGVLLINSCQVNENTYVYAQALGTALHPNVTPARAMVFCTFNNLLVGQQFISSFKEDGTDFDDSRISKIEKGKTTKADVIAALGHPSGESVYPMIKNKEDSAITYEYTEVKGTAFSLRVYRKSLVVSIGPDNVVTDVAYTASGER